MFPKLIPFSIIGGTGGALDFYVPLPVRCVVRNIQAAASADPGDAETITAVSGSTNIGVLTYGSSIAPGATGTYVADATTGGTVLAAGSVVKLTISQLTAAATFVGYIEVDEFAMTVQ